MAKRFEPNRRLLTTLVGSNLYGSPDACIRELLQNAWDAIQLRKYHADGKGGQIAINFSVSQGWFEVIDDGIGMDQGTVEESFFEIGQDKIEVLNLGDEIPQIGHFGIGVLSIFLLADRFEVTTKSTDPDKGAIYFQVTNIDTPVEFLSSDHSAPGTSIKVYPRPTGEFDLASIPDAVRSYARHVPCVTLRSLDDNAQESLSDTWATDSLFGVREVAGVPPVRSGRLGFLAALKENSGALVNQITICNTGFLVEEAVDDLIPTRALGVGGEIDLVSPSDIRIGISRERIQRDTGWQELGAQLQTFLIQAALEELATGALSPSPTSDSDEVKRTILLWYHFLPSAPPFSELYEALDCRVYQSVPFSQAERPPTTLQSLLEGHTSITRLYYRQLGTQTQFTQQIDDDGLPIRFAHEIRDSVRIGALRAKGFTVIDLKHHQVNIRTGSTVQTQQIQEQPLVERCLAKRGVALVNIVDAPDSDMDMRSIEELPLLRSALTIAGGLRFASVADSNRRIITDPTGVRYINLRNPEVQQLLRLLPDAISNPLKHKLLEGYLRLEDFKLREAREILIGLLSSDNLPALARAEMAPLTKNHLEGRISDLLQKLKP